MPPVGMRYEVSFPSQYACNPQRHAVAEVAESMTRRATRVYGLHVRLLAPPPS